MPICLSLCQKLGAPAFDCNALTQIWAILIEQIAMSLVLDGNVSLQEPVEGTWAWHGQRLFLKITAKLALPKVTISLLFKSAKPSSNKT